MQRYKLLLARLSHILTYVLDCNAIRWAQSTHNISNWVSIYGVYMGIGVGTVGMGCIERSYMYMSHSAYLLSIHTIRFPDIAGSP